MTLMRGAGTLIPLLLTLGASAPYAQHGVDIAVSEPAGIRRTEFPVSAHRVAIARGLLADAEQARLRAGDSDVPCQFAVAERWPDGSVRLLEMDFNVSIGPNETRKYRLEYGPDTTATAGGRGLRVTEGADGIQVGSLRFGTGGSPLVASANYRGEFIGEGLNTVTITDRAGTTHDLGAAQGLSAELLKRGPLNVVVRYSGRMPIDDRYAVPFSITFEMPNSKSWFKMTAEVDDPARRVKALALEMPLGYGAHPWTWDFGTDSGTYGALRAPGDSVTFTQAVAVNGVTSWEVRTGTAQGEPRLYESAATRRNRLASGWGHLVDANHAVAFAIERFGEEPGTYTVAANGSGQTTFAFAPAAPAARHRFVIYQHFVATPVAIGAATSPAAILHPLIVK